MDLSKLAKQFSGRKFGELVLHHYRTQNIPTIVKAQQGTVNELPEEVRPLLESWIDEVSWLGKDSSFWRRDCGEVLLDICGRASHKLAGCSASVTEDHVFSMFQVVLLNFAYSAHRNAQSKAFIQKAIGIGYLRRIFS